jgi:hypothetical protein
MLALLLLAAILLSPALALAADAVPAGFPAPSFFAGIPAEKAATVAGLIVTLLVQLLKSSAFGGWIRTIDRRKRILVPLALAATVGVVGPWLGIVGWEDAAKLACETAAVSVFAGEAVISQLMGQRTGEAVAAPAPAPSAPEAPTPTAPPAGPVA